MARYSAGAKTTAGSTTLPILSVYGVDTPTRGGTVREVGVTNTTTTAVDLKLTRLTTAGTQGTGITEAKYEPESPAAACTAFQTHSVAPTLGDDLGYRASLGAAIGAGVIWTMGDRGVRFAGASQGIGVIPENGTGQACQVYFVWDE